MTINYRTNDPSLSQAPTPDWEQKTRAVACDSQRIDTKARWVAKKISENYQQTGTGMTLGAVKRLMDSKDRGSPGLFDAAVQRAVAQGLVIEIDGGIAPAS